MGTKTNISWTETTWNPVIGCSKVSPGCAHCYAEELSKSPKMRRFGYTGLPWTPANAELNVQLKPERLEQPLHWREPRRVFVNSMSDLFHELVPFSFIDKVFAVMALTPWHIYQILTKRPERMREYMQSGRKVAIWVQAEQMMLMGRRYFGPTLTGTLGSYTYQGGPMDDKPWPLSNVWLGTSIENQRWADERIPHLLKVPATVRFLSCEPLLGPLDLTIAKLPSEATCHPLKVQEGNYPVSGFVGPIKWVIVGGESGPHFRPMNLNWARSIRDQCIEAGAAFFFKQSGGRRSETGKLLDGVEWAQMPEVG